MLKTVYRVITENGYSEFYNQQDANTFAEGREIQTLQVDVKEPPVSMVLANSLSAIRYAKEVGGITVGDVEIQTDRDSRANLTAAYVLAAQDSEFTVIWKASNGFVTLNAAQIVGIAQAVANHVKKCFAAEQAVTENLENLEADQLQEEFEAAYND